MVWEGGERKLAPYLIAARRAGLSRRGAGDFRQTPCAASLVVSSERLAEGLHVAPSEPSAIVFRMRASARNKLRPKFETGE